jgi:polysaccharide biosynthesis transport protein
MFLNNPNNPEAIAPQSQEANKLIYLNSPNIDEEDDDIDISELFRFLRRRGLIIIGTTIALTTVLSSWILSKPPIYQGNFQLLVEPLNADNSQLDLLSNLSGGGLKSDSLDYESQINVLKSPLVINPILQKIQSRYPEIKYALTEGKKDEKEEALLEKLTVTQSGDTKIIKVSYKDESEEKIFFILNQLMKGYLDYQALDYISNLNQSINFTKNQISRVREEVAVLESQLENFQQTNNLINPATQNEVLASQSRVLLGKIEAVQTELGATTKLANELQNKLDLTPEEGVIVARLNQQPNYIKLIGQIKDTETQIGLESLRLGDQHPIIKSLMARKEELVSLLNEETTKILGSKGTNLSLDFLTSISNNQAVTQEFFATNNKIEVLKATEKGLNEAWEKLNQQVNSLSTTNKEYYQIQRELTTASESLNRLLALNENLQIEAAKERSPWKLLTPLDQNIIEDVSGTTRKLALIGVASLFCGTILGLLVDKLDSAFHSVDDVKRSIDLPSLGIIPYHKNLKVISDKNKSARASFNQGKGLFADAKNIPDLDAYFSLFTNINLLGSDNSIRSIVIGAAEASEGKSTTSTFLAKAAAMLGKKVLIVDVDMRKPRLHKYLGVKNTIGLSNLIADDAPLEKAIQASPQENLFIITAGSKPPNPTRIISSQKMRDLMAKVKDDFDFIIYDTPPLMGFSDGKILTPSTDGLVFVVRLDKTHRPNVQQVLNDLRMSKLSVLGVVLNGVKNHMRGSDYSDYSDYSDQSQGES